MKKKSKWKGAVFVTLALVLALGLTLAAVPARSPDAEAVDLAWSNAEGVLPYGLPTGVGQIIDIAVTGNTVFVLSDLDAGVDAFIEVIRSDDGGYRWEPARVITLAAVLNTGVDIEVSPNFAADGTVMVLATDRFVYLSRDRGVTWPFATLVLGVPANVVHDLAIAPNFDGLGTGTIAVGVTQVAPIGVGSTVHLNTWSGAPAVWGGWAALNPASSYGPPNICWAVDFAPEPGYALWVITVQQIGPNTYGEVTTIGGAWPAVAAADIIAAAAVPTSAVIDFGDDYNPTLRPNEFFVGTTSAVAAGRGVWWWQPVLFWQQLYIAPVPAVRWATSGLVADGDYARATLIAGCSTFPVTYKLDVRSGLWDPAVFIEADGGPIGAVSGTVGVFLAYRGMGNTVFAATADLVGLYTVGDLCCLSRSDDFADSWFDTCLTSEDFRLRVLDMAWLDADTGIIVCDDDATEAVALPGAWESTFKTWDGGLSWKRVDRWQGVTQIYAAPDGTIFLLDTSATGDKVLVSTDGGETFAATAIDPDIAALAMTAMAGGSATDIFVGSVTGRMYYSHDGGSTWTDLGQKAAAIHSMWVPDNYDTASHVCAGVTSLAGMPEILMSTDRGVTWTQLGSATEAGAWGPWVIVPPTGWIDGDFSPTYDGAEDGMLYVNTVSTLATRIGVFRWDTLAASPVWVFAGPVAINISAIELVYVDDVVKNALWALQDAAAVLRGSWYPEKTTAAWPGVLSWRGGNVAQDVGSTWGWIGAGARRATFEVVVGSSVTMFSVDILAGADRIRTWTDTDIFLAPPEQVSPAEGAIVPSNNTATGEPVMFSWKHSGANLYQVGVCKDLVSLEAVTDAAGVTWLGNPAPANVVQDTMPVGSLADGETYYWRVRAQSVLNAVPAHRGAWSGWIAFTMEAVELHVAPTLISPTAGALDQPVRPLFRWSGVQDATGYLLQVDDDPTFATPVIDETLGVQQTYEPAADLAWEDTYSWRVKAVGVDFETAWAESILTTMPEWMAPEPEVTPAWVWVTIILGALLAIAVIVLIVRTRRPV